MPGLTADYRFSRSLGYFTKTRRSAYFTVLSAWHLKPNSAQNRGKINVVKLIRVNTPNICRL